jgi:putative pyruvate formate lyase activating enzyme
MASYLKLEKSVLERKSEAAWNLLKACRLCPRVCGASRTQDRADGFCQMGKDPKIASSHPHFGEERVLVGQGGSGTIFFSSCNLACAYCQNSEISQRRVGRRVGAEELAKMMLLLQKGGCHNINLVSPTIWVPQILRALLITIDKGLTIPLVYNTGGYESAETLKLLKGTIDIYMPDIKYSNNSHGLKYSAAADYWEVVQKAVKEMHRQVGDLVIDSRGIAQRGLLIRHLVLPNRIAGTGKVMEFIASLSRETAINLMDQYYPTNRAYRYSELNRRVTSEEFQEAIALAKRAGLHRLLS